MSVFDFSSSVSTTSSKASAATLPTRALRRVQKVNVNLSKFEINIIYFQELQRFQEDSINDKTFRYILYINLYLWINTIPWFVLCDSCSVVVQSDDVWLITFTGAAGTLYAGETFTLRVRFTSDYPMDSPECIFLLPAPVHTHIYSNGHICLNILVRSCNIFFSAIITLL